MNIAILNLCKDDEINYTLDCLENINNEIISVKIDLFINKNQNINSKYNDYINKVIPLDMDNINILNFKNKLNILKYYTRNKYNIAIDTQGTLKSSYFNYQLTGKTAGFSYNSFLGKIISVFYDEKIALKSKIEKKE